MKEKAATETLTCRERFLKTLNHEEPDRVPIDLGSVGGGITDVAYSRVKEYLGIKGDEGTTYTTTLSVSQFDERVLQALNVDVRRVGLRTAQGESECGGEHRERLPDPASGARHGLPPLSRQPMIVA